MKAPDLQTSESLNLRTEVPRTRCLIAPRPRHPRDLRLNSRPRSFRAVRAFRGNINSSIQNPPPSGFIVPPEQDTTGFQAVLTGFETVSPGF